MDDSRSLKRGRAIASKRLAGRGTVLLILAGAVGAMGLGARSVEAQGLSITPSVGAHHAGSSIRRVWDAIWDGDVAADKPFAFGLALESGDFRLSTVYASGAGIDSTGLGLEGTEQIGDGSVLAMSVDLVYRPLGRGLALEPYVVGGLGFKRERYSFENDDLADLLPNGDGETDFVWHLALGLEFSLGGLRLVVELTDFLNTNDDRLFGRHDGFALLGLRFGGP